MLRDGILQMEFPVSAARISVNKVPCNAFVSMSAIICFVGMYSIDNSRVVIVRCESISYFCMPSNLLSNIFSNREYFERILNK